MSNDASVEAKFRLFFKAGDELVPSAKYVCWIDMMGTSEVMSRSLRQSVNFMAKIHVAFLRAKKDGIDVYPMMDGAYVTSESQNLILSFLRHVFEDLAHDFTKEQNSAHRFLARAAIAFGPVIAGNMLPASSSYELDQNRPYRSSLLFGIPMIQANSSERNAPPFGVFVHESARGFAPIGSKTLPVSWWRWQDFGAQPAFFPRFCRSIDDHFEWCRNNSISLGYAAERIQTHQKMAHEYFGIQKAKSS